MNTNENKYLDLLAKVLAKNATSQEEEALNLWAKEDKENKAFVDEVSQSWELSGNYGKNIPVDTDAAWNKLEQKIKVSTTPYQASNRDIIYLFRTSKFFRRCSQAAAVILVSLAVWWSMSPSTLPMEMALLETGDQEQKEVRLPDGSTVILNENSTLSYPTTFENRVVELEGEAFFDVTKKEGKTFEILTATTKTIVLGTSFNVRAYQKDKAVEVAVVTGKVAVQELNKAANKVLLVPNERVVFDEKNKILTKEIVSNNGAIAWKTQELVFENTAIRDIVRTLERYFDVQIESENEALLDCHYTGKFDKPQLEEIFKALSFSTDIVAKQDEQKYILIGQGCD